MPFSEGGRRLHGMETLMPVEPLDLFAEREALEQALQKLVFDHSKRDQLKLAMLHIFEQSFSDGISFAEKFYLGGRFLKELIEDPKLFLLHPKIMQALVENYQEYSSFIDESKPGNESEWVRHLQWMQIKIKEQPDLSDRFLKLRYFSDDDTIHDFSAEDEPGMELPAIHRQIDAYYDHFRLANPVPQVQPRNQTTTSDSRTPTERQAETYVARQLDHQRGKTTPVRYTELETIKKKALTKGLIDEIKASLAKRGLKPEDFTIEPEANGEYKVTFVRPATEKAEADKSANLKELFDLSKFELVEIKLDKVFDLDDNSITSIDGQIVFGEKISKSTKNDEIGAYGIHYSNKIKFIALPEDITGIKGTKVFTSQGKVYYELDLDNHINGPMVIITENTGLPVLIEDGEIMKVGDEILVVNDEPDSNSKVHFPDGRVVTTPILLSVLDIVKTGNRYYYHLYRSDSSDDVIAYFENNKWNVVVEGDKINDITETPSGFMFAMKSDRDIWSTMQLTVDGLSEIGTDFSGNEITNVFPLADSYGSVATGKNTSKQIVTIGDKTTLWDSVQVQTKEGESLIFGRNRGQGDYIYSSFNPKWQKIPGKLIADIETVIKLKDNFVINVSLGGSNCLMFTDGNESVPYGNISSFHSINNEVVVVENEVPGHYNDGVYVSEYTLKDQYGVPLTPKFMGKNLHLSIRDGYIVLALQEQDKFVVYRRKIDEKSTTAEATTDSTLTPTETKKLELLNALSTGHQSDMEAYFAKDDRTKQFEDHEAATIARSASGAMQYQLDTDPTLLRGVVPAKDDQPTPELIQRTMLLLFPSIKESRSWQRAQAAEQKRVKKARAKKEKGQPENYFGDQQQEQLVDGDPHEKEPVELFKITPAPNDFIVRFIGGRYDERDHAWHEVAIPRTDTADAKGERDRFKTEVLLKPMGQTVLPTVLGAEISDARIEASGHEQELEIQQTGLNAARVDAGSGADKLTYTQEKPREAPASFDISLRRYRKFLTEQSGLNATELTADIAGLHQELWAAIEPAVRNASMLERIDIITKYIRDIGYYDFDNGEIKGDKWGKGLGEKLEIMRARLDELKLRRGAAPLRASKKQYAGICTDFAELGVALLRRAELAAGVMSGFQTHADASATITTKDAHSLNFVLWPTLDGGVTIIPIDVTPSGVTVEEEEYLRTMRVPDKMEKVTRQVSLYGGDKKVSASMATLETASTAKQVARQKESKNFAEKIKSIPLTTADVERWRAFLNIARYSGLSLSDSLGTTDFNYLMEEQIKEQQRNPIVASGDPSQAMVELVMDFRDRWQTDTPGSDPTVALLALRTLTKKAVVAKLLPPKYLDIIDAFGGKQSKPASNTKR